MAYTRPPYNAYNVTWLGTSAYTSPAAAATDFDVGAVDYSLSVPISIATFENYQLTVGTSIVVYEALQPTIPIQIATYG